MRHIADRLLTREVPHNSASALRLTSETLERRGHFLLWRPANRMELHESLAPLYYLYGTTLLCSVEESDVMMAAGNAGNAGNPRRPSTIQMKVSSSAPGTCPRT